ncbi:MAG: FAD-dependent oxidoreductase [Cyanobium sp. Prado107]|nr:FAD-dependent oxidoreductase [Cyanobium sp. Prado107]
MNVLTARLLEGGSTTLSSAEIESLRSRISGSVVLPHDATYDDDRRLWNGMFDHHPALIVLCQSADDVVEAVRFCRARNLLVAVRGGGHNVAGLAGADQAVTIDLSRMRDVHVDPALRRVRVEAGALLGDVDRATQAFQLVVPTGVVSAG